MECIGYFGDGRHNFEITTLKSASEFWDFEVTALALETCSLAGWCRPNCGHCLSACSAPVSLFSRVSRTTYLEQVLPDTEGYKPAAIGAFPLIPAIEAAFVEAATGD